MAEGTPKIGEKAKTDYQNFQDYVIYGKCFRLSILIGNYIFLDVFKIIGRPFKEIKIDPRWGFKLVEENGIVHFQVQTPSGPKLIPQELVISAFLKAMKLCVESYTGTEIKEICLSTDFILSQSQKAVFEKAALKNNLRILFFVVTDA